MVDKIDEIKSRADKAQVLINTLHTEKLDYHTEYLPLIESNHDIYYILAELKKYKALAQNGQSAINTSKKLIEKIRQQEIDNG